MASTLEKSFTVPEKATLKLEGSSLSEKAVTNIDIPPTYQEATIVSVDDAKLPSISEVVTHLKLLFAFEKLRERVATDSSLFGINDDGLPSGVEGSEDAIKSRQVIVEKRWDVYVQRAALRFEDWWKGLRGKQPGKLIKMKDLYMDRSFSFGTGGGLAEVALKVKHLPPLDVLMVWHSFLLSPRKYLEDCLLQGMTPLWYANFPWAEIDQAIDFETGDYEPGQDAVAKFEELTNRKWSNGEDNCVRIIECPKCSRTISVDDTTFPERVQAIKKPRGTEKTALKLVQSWLEEGQGWADANFRRKCAMCEFQIDQDALCAVKFIKDVKKYDPGHSITQFDPWRLAELSPMPGTILDPRTGLQQSCPTKDMSSWIKKSDFFPMALVDTMSHVDSSGNHSTSPAWQRVFTMNNVRNEISKTLDCSDQMLYATGKTQRRAAKAQRATVRRMMSYYNDNPWMFTLDLASAVHRQSKFVEKMYQIDWLHSPALADTAARVIVKYQRFIKIMAENPKEMAVPTLDIDLAWHTAQLTPSKYWVYTVKKTNRFVDHDDKVSENKLSEAFARTSKNYQRLFNEPYSECTCWYCEAMHASVSKFPGRFMLPNSAGGYRRPTHAPDDGTAPHISTHNAVRLDFAPAKYKIKSREHLKFLEKAYQRACERAKKENRPPPVRRHPDADAYRYAYGGDMYFGNINGRGSGKALALGVGAGLAVGVGLSVIYFGADGGLYFDAQDPQHVNASSGGSGGCVSGACGGGVGWGGCAGDIDGSTGACGGTGGSCSGGDGGGCGGGCGGCGGCGG